MLSVKKVQAMYFILFNGKGTMFNNGLMSDGPKSGGWAEKVLYNPRFDIGDPTRVVDPS